MNRRLGGLALLLLAGLTLGVLPNLIGRPVGGSAIAINIPAPPQVGQCVAALSALPQDDGGPDDSRITYPSASYGPCGTSVLGEVMSFDPLGFPAQPPTVATYSVANAQCELSEVNYVGSIGPFDLTDPNRPSIAWQTTVTIQSVSVGPSSLQQRAGQTWTACLGTTSDGLRYNGRIASALTRGSLPPNYATCWASPPAEVQLGSETSLTSCAEPHSAEILGTTQITDSATTVAEVERTCRGFVSRAMRTADPTRGGVVSVSAYSMNGPSVMPLTSGDLMDGFLGCVATVASPHQLVGTLIGLGDHTAPITG